MIYPLKPTHDFFFSENFKVKKSLPPKLMSSCFTIMKIMENFKTVYIRAKSGFILNFRFETKYCFGDVRVQRHCN